MGLGVLVVVLVGGYILWKKYFPASASGTVGTIVGSAADKIELAAAVASLENVLLLCWARGDKTSMTATVALRDQIVAYVQSPVVPTPVPVPTPTPAVPVIVPGVPQTVLINGAVYQIQIQPVPVSK